MDIELFILNGYGQFVWPAFIFTFLSCFLLYLKTRREFKKQQKRFFNEFKQLQNAEIKVAKEKGSPKEIWYGSSI